MNFYTNVTQWGNFLKIREVVNGQRITRKVRYKPTLYMTVGKPTDWKTLDGKFVAPVEHDSMKEAREWVANYKNQPGMVHGSTMFAYNYIADEYPKRVEYDLSLIHI